MGSERVARFVHVAALLVGGWLLWPGGAGAAPPAPGESMLSAHNAVRSRHGVPPLQWSTSLAADAGEWADHLAGKQSCRMQHDEGNDAQGENLYWASAARWSDGRREVQAITPEHVVASWASEQADYDYARNRCRAGKACGHYTQIVWRDTTQVGCARSLCADQGQIWVCRYLPPGNWVGEKPF